MTTDALKAIRERADAALAEIARMRPVVEAAQRSLKLNLISDYDTLYSAVEKYEADK